MSVPSSRPTRLNIRFKRVSDVTLIERAAASSGLPVAEWTRRALIKTADEQIHGNGIQMLILKNILFIRRCFELSEGWQPETEQQAKAWATKRAKDATHVGEVQDTP